MKSRIFYFILLFVSLFFSTNTGDMQAQSLAGKWQKNGELDVLHFSKEGAFKRSFPGYEDAYGLYYFQEGVLGIVFADDPENVIPLNITSQDAQQMTLEVVGTGEKIYLSYIGEQEIVEEYVNLLVSEYGDQIGEATRATQNANWTATTDPTPEPTYLPTSGKPNTHMTYDNQTASIVGNWHYTLFEQPIDLVLTADGFIYRTNRFFMNGLEYLDAIEDFGRYTFENNQITFQFFSGNEEKGSFLIHNLTPNSFQVLNSENTYETWQRTGNGELTPAQRSTLDTWTIFLRLAGQWDNGGEVFKFMDYGLVLISEKNNPNNFISAIYSVQDGVLQFKALNQDTYFWTAKVVNQDREKMDLVANNTDLTYYFKGKPQLEGDQLFFYQEFIKTQHRINMSAIDDMDGERDWIWVKEKKY